MAQLNPYLTFGGTCREALTLYKEALNGEILSLRTFEESPDDVPTEFKHHVMHADFRAGDVYIMASDGGPHYSITPGNAITLNLNFNDPAEQERVFAKLSVGGTVTMPLQETFWGSKFGLITDKFGINWMLDYAMKS